MDDVAQQIERLRLIQKEFFRLGADSRLYHVVRTPVPFRDTESIDLREHWEDFLGGQVPFGFRSYHAPGGRVQQTCFFGDERALPDYTALASRAAREMPLESMALAMCDEDVVECCDSFTIALYQVAIHISERIQFNLRGFGTYRGHIIGRDALDILALWRSDRDQQRRWVDNWHESFLAEGMGDVSYVYASLGTNVFVAAAESLEYAASRLTPDKERNTNDVVNYPATTESGNQLESILKQAGKLSPTEREIVTVLFRAGKRLVTEEVLVELEKTRGSTASTGNTKAALAGLVRRDVLDNRQNVKPPGYGIFLPG